MIVGLSEVAFNVNQELEDLGSAIGNMNQTYQFNGTGGNKGRSNGSVFSDSRECWLLRLRCGLQCCPNRRRQRLPELTLSLSGHQDSESDSGTT